MSNSEQTSKLTQTDFLQLTSSAGDSPARTSRWLDVVRDWLAGVPLSGMNFSGWSRICGHLGSLSKMSLVYYLRTRVKTSRSSSPVLPNAGMVWRGACWTANTTEYPRDADECSLSDILEPHVLRKYYLTLKAAAGILRRAKARGRVLPPQLEHALNFMLCGEAQAGQRVTPSPVTLPAGKTQTAKVMLPSQEKHIPSTERLPRRPFASEHQGPSQEPNDTTETQHPSQKITSCNPSTTPSPSAPVEEDSLIRTGPSETSLWRVRRLTPTECERLQGFPDGWTLLPQKRSTQK